VISFGMDTFGRLSPSAQEFTDLLAQHAVAARVADDTQTFKRQLYDRLAVTLQKHNTAMACKWRTNELWRMRKEAAIDELQASLDRPAPMQVG
jgi:hypothetical protein